MKTKNDTSYKSFNSESLLARTLKRQKTKIWAIALIGTSIAALALLKIPPTYNVHATILFDGAAATQMEALRTRALSRNTLYEALVKTQEIESGHEAQKADTNNDFKAFKLGLKTAPFDPLDSLSPEEMRRMASIQKSLHARIEGTRLHLSYHNPDAKAAQNTLSTLALYLVETLPSGGNPTLNALESEHREKIRQLNALSLKYGSKHPQIQDLIVNIKGLENHIGQNRANNATITALPQAMTTPNHPDFKRGLPMAFILSLAFGLAIAFIAESARKTVLSGKQLEHITNVPCFALIPQARPEKSKPLQLHILDRPTGQCAEAIKSLYLNIKLDDPIHATKTNKKNKIITVTSALPEEGKTILALWLAFTAAKSGEKTILVDADMREPSVHKYLGRRNPRSIVEYLADQNAYEDIIDENTTGGIDVITARSVPSASVDLITSPRMTALINELRKTYDRVIIDSPAAMVTADARALQKHSDLVLFTAKWNSTKDAVIHNALSQFLKIETPRIATVLTQIDLKKHTQYGYGMITSENTI